MGTYIICRYPLSRYYVKQSSLNSLEVPYKLTMDLYIGTCNKRYNNEILNITLSANVELVFFSLKKLHSPQVNTHPQHEIILHYHAHMLLLFNFHENFPDHVIQVIMLLMCIIYGSFFGSAHFQFCMVNMMSMSTLPNVPTGNPVYYLLQRTGNPVYYLLQYYKYLPS